VAEVLTCVDVEQGGLVTGYVAGNLTAARAGDFEAHYFACEHCFRLLETATDLRASLGEHLPDAESRPSFPARATRPAWIGGLLAAVLVMAVAGLWMWRQAAPLQAPVYRGAGELHIAASVTAASIELSWDAVDGAALYRVELSAANSPKLARRETSAARLTLALSELPAGWQAPLRARVTALGAQGNRLAESRLTVVPVANPR